MKNLLILLSISLLVFACGDDNGSNPTNETPENNYFKATVSGDEQYDFDANGVNFYDIGDTWSVAGDMLNDEQQIVEIHVAWDEDESKMEYDLSSTELESFLRKRSRNGFLMLDYTFDVTGSLTFTKKVKDTIQGTFNFTASTSDTIEGGQKTVTISNGEFYYARVPE